MIEGKTAKIKQLGKDLPEGLLVDAAWLEAKGIASNLRSYYVKNGWLEQPVRSLYRRPRGSINWQQIVISLQTLLETPLTVGGKTALELQGFAHYISSTTKTIHLYGPDKPPGWLVKLELPQRFIYHNCRKLFCKDPVISGLESSAFDVTEGTGRNADYLQKESLTELAWGQWDWTLTLSRPERAYLEMLDELPQRESFHQVDMIMQGAVNFTPRRLQKLLSSCNNIKVKRLFFFLADRHQHAWLKQLDKEAIDFGKGKRMLVKGGRFDPKYQITVPGDLDGNQ